MQRREVIESKKLETEEKDDYDEEPICGGITEVEDSQNCPDINSLARFAVDHYNKKENSFLEFVKVVNAKRQRVGGVAYYITLEAKVGEKVNVYEARICEQLWMDVQRELYEFKLVDDASVVHGETEERPMTSMRGETKEKPSEPIRTLASIRPKRIIKKPARLRD